MDMQIQQLKSFVAVALLRHFTQAAESLGVTQPSLSKQIRALETDLGATLFSRTRGGITLTAAGEALLPLAQRILADIETARREVQDVVGLQHGRVRLGATPSLCTSLVAEVLRRYRDRHPKIELRINEGNSRELVDALGRGVLDLAVVILPEQGLDESLSATPILRESLVVASTRPLTSRSAGGSAGRSTDGRFRVADLAHHQLVMFGEGYALRDATLAACRRAGFTPTFAVEGGEMDAVLGFVEAGLGVALVPRLVLTTRPNLVATALAPPGVHRTIALAYRREPELSHAAQEMRTTLLGYLREAAQAGFLPPGVDGLTDP
jgi:DNA-binding transcriptional LysR family regulator